MAVKGHGAGREDGASHCSLPTSHFVLRRKKTTKKSAAAIHQCTVSVTSNALKSKVNTLLYAFHQHTPRWMALARGRGGEQPLCAIAPNTSRACHCEVVWTGLDRFISLLRVEGQVQRGLWVCRHGGTLPSSPDGFQH